MWKFVLGFESLWVRVRVGLRKRNELFNDDRDSAYTSRLEDQVKPREAINLRRNMSRVGGE